MPRGIGVGVGGTGVGEGTVVAVGTIRVGEGSAGTVGTEAGVAAGEGVPQAAKNTPAVGAANPIPTRKRRRDKRERNDQPPRG